MNIFARTKRVTDPLDERVKDRIVGRVRIEPAYVSSGSEHSEHGDVTSSSPCLSELLDCFLREEEDDDGETCNNNIIAVDDDVKETDSDSECDSDRTDLLIESLISIFNHQNIDKFRNVLLANVLKATEVFKSNNNNNNNKQMLNRNVMLFLQKNGYNAAVCKTKWQSCGGLTSGNHEFIDVVRSCPFDSGTRYFIDVNFAGEFDIARETNNFRRLFQRLPAVFVGKSEDLKQIVKLLSDETRRSLRSRGLLLPPWRKNRFMQNKWFGPYRRTVNYTPTNITMRSSAYNENNSSTGGNVKCRSIGFNAVSGFNGALIHAATRTR